MNEPNDSADFADDIEQTLTDEWDGELDADGHGEELGCGVEAVPRTDPMAGQLVRLLVIEDEAERFERLTSFLQDIERCVFDVRWVQTYDEGLDEIMRDEHEVCLVDVGLGDRDGIELIQEARRMGSRRPLIAMSSRTDRILDLAAMRAGASDFMPKGEMRPDSIERMVRYAIERQRAEQRMIWLSRFDQLTGLANRAQFRERLVQSLARAA